MPAKAPLPARSVRAFVRAFLAKNEPSLLELQRRIKVGLQKLPPEYLGDNGKDFLKDDMMKTTFCYAYIQVMRAGQRRDPPHYDGGASWLHMGLTIFGRRKVHWNLQKQDSANGNFSNTADSPPRPSHKIILFARPRSDPMIRRTRASTGSGMLERSPCCFAQAATPKRLAGSGHAEAARGGCGFKPAVEPRKTAIVFVLFQSPSMGNRTGMPLQYAGVELRWNLRTYVRAYVRTYVNFVCVRTYVHILFD